MQSKLMLFAMVTEQVNDLQNEYNLVGGVKIINAGIVHSSIFLIVFCNKTTSIDDLIMRHLNYASKINFAKR